MDNKFEYEGYSYLISGDENKELRKIPVNGGEPMVLHSFGGDFGAGFQWHRKSSRSLWITGVSDGFVYLTEHDKGDNDWSEWDKTYYYKIKIDGTGKLVLYKCTIYDVAPDKDDNYISYYDDEGKFIRSEPYNREA